MECIWVYFDWIYGMDLEYSYVDFGEDFYGFYMVFRVIVERSKMVCFNGLELYLVVGWVFLGWSLMVGRVDY